MLADPVYKVRRVVVMIQDLPRGTLAQLARDPSPYVREVAEWNLRGLVPMDLRADIFRGLPYAPEDAAASNAGPDST